MGRPFLLCVLIAGTVLGSCTPAAKPPAKSAEVDSDRGLRAAIEEAAVGVDDGSLRELLRSHWAWTLEDSPEWATRLGVHDFDDRITDHSEAAHERRRARLQEHIAAVQAIDVDVLSERDQTTWQLFVEKLESSLAADVCQSHRWTVDPRNNPITSYSELPELHALTSPRDGETLVARYRKIPEQIRHRIDNLRAGAKVGLLPNAESTRRVIELTRRELAKPVREMALSLPLKDSPDGPAWTPELVLSFSNELHDAIENDVRPAFEAYARFLESELVLDARSDEKVGLAHLPIGEACYAARIREHTTLSKSADELHQIGLAEVERINSEMVELSRRAFGVEDLAAGIARLRDDKTLYFSTAEEIEAEARATLEEAQEKSPAFFKTLPATRCVVRPIPEHEAPFTTIAYYRPPHPDGSKPGEYFVNTYEPTTRPRFEARVLAIHEAVPGHHLQIALAKEQQELPAFRRHTWFNAFTEGWALYTERLGEEMGLYRDDLDRMGTLSFDAWRASRLVVDTGIHAKGWSRAQADAYMREHTALALNNIDNEVDRYINWPGQALSYKIGQLEILRLRADAERELAERFELPGFHDAVLGGGAVSLPVLERRVKDWVNAVP